MNEVPHWDWSDGAASDTKLGMAWLTMLYAALVQSVHVTLEGIVDGGLATICAMLVRVRVPTESWMLVRVCVTQLALPLNNCIVKSTDLDHFIMVNSLFETENLADGWVILFNERSDAGSRIRRYA